MKLELKHDSGFFSCCTVGVYDIIEYIKKHKLIPEVSFSRIFNLYKDHLGQDVYDNFFEFNPLQELDINKIAKIKYNRDSSFNYNSEDLLAIKPIIEKWFTPSNSVLDYVSLFTNKYEINVNKTLAILFRGTDKATEIKETSYSIFTSGIKDIMDNAEINRVFVQTDQTQFIDFLKHSFPNIDFFTIKEIPTTATKKQLYKETIKKNKVTHAQMFLASMQILSNCKFLINHTGNVARWAITYRGHTKNTIQYKSSSILK